MQGRCLRYQAWLGISRGRGQTPAKHTIGGSADGLPVGLGADAVLDVAGVVAAGCTESPGSIGDLLRPCEESVFMHCVSRRTLSFSRLESGVTGAMACTLGYLHRQRIRMRAMGHEARHADAGKAALPKEHLSGARAHTPGGLSVMMTALPGPLGTPPKPYRVVVIWASLL